MKLMIVEDNASMRQLIRSFVSDLADCIHEYSDGAQAFRGYAEHRPDWVLMDIKMTEVDGIAATRQITDAFPEANILIITDYDDRQLREAARLAGARDYVLKENLIALRPLLLAASKASSD